MFNVKRTYLASGFKSRRVISVWQIVRSISENWTNNFIILESRSRILRWSVTSSRFCKFISMWSQAWNLWKLRVCPTQAISPRWALGRGLVWLHLLFHRMFFFTPRKNQTKTADLFSLLFCPGLWVLFLLLDISFRNRFWHFGHSVVCTSKWQLFYLEKKYTTSKNFFYFLPYLKNLITAFQKVLLTKPVGIFITRWPSSLWRCLRISI